MRVQPGECALDKRHTLVEEQLLPVIVNTLQGVSVLVRLEYTRRSNEPFDIALQYLALAVALFYASMACVCHTVELEDSVGHTNGRVNKVLPSHLKVESSPCQLGSVSPPALDSQMPAKKSSTLDPMLTGGISRE